MSRIPATGSIQSSPGQRGANDFRDVDLDQFLKLLIAELQNQDPLNPMDNSEMLEQIGQIREISATNHLSDTLNAVLLGQNVTTASSLIGRRIEALSDAGKNVEGIVDRVTVDVDPRDESARVLRVHIGEDRIQLDNIRTIVREDDARLTI